MSLTQQFTEFIQQQKLFEDKITNLSKQQEKLNNSIQQLFHENLTVIVRQINQVEIRLDKIEQQLQTLDPHLV